MTREQLKKLQGKPWNKKSAAERNAEADAYAKVSEADILALSRPPTRGELLKLEAQARRGRPRVGKGAARVQISMERGLLARIDAHARKRRMTRSQLIAEGIRRVLGAA